MLFRRNDDVKTALHILLEHLDASLDVADAMASVRRNVPELRPGADTDAIFDRLEALQAFTGDMRTLEAQMLTKVRQARHWAERLAQLEPAPDTGLQMFLAGTHGLIDAIDRMARPQACSFETGDQMLPYLRDRGLVPPDTLSLDGAVSIPPAEQLLIAGWVPVADYIALADETLTALAEAYGFAAGAQPVGALTQTVEIGSVITSNGAEASETGGGESVAETAMSPSDGVAAESPAPAVASGPHQANGADATATAAATLPDVAVPEAQTQHTGHAADADTVPLAEVVEGASDRPETVSPQAEAKPTPKGLMARVLELAD